MTEQAKPGRQEGAKGSEQEAGARTRPAAGDEVVFLSCGSLTVTPEGLTLWGPFPAPVRSGEGMEAETYLWTGERPGNASWTHAWQGGVLVSPSTAAEGDGRVGGAEQEKLP